MNDALLAVISKEVQIQFTAFGRQKNNMKKLNFSKTNIYSLLMGKLIIQIKENLNFKNTNQKLFYPTYLH